MNGNEENFPLMEVLKKIRKIENIKMSLMSRKEMINYIVEQMETIERVAPQIVEHVEYDFKDHYSET